MILWSARFSAALCRGLIEAIDDEGHLCMHDLRFPRLYAAASLKQRRRLHVELLRRLVFRGFMPRPH